MKKLTLRSGLLATTTICNAVFPVLAGTAVLAGAAMLMPSGAYAQDLTSGTLVGNVKTESGAAAGGATVTIVGATNGVTQTATADSAGRFQITQIPVGQYTVTITGTDGTTSTDTVTVTLGSASSYDFTLAAAAPAQTGEVVVRGKARRNLDFDRTTTGGVLDVQQVASRLPVGRSIEALADLVPGISVNDVFGPPSISGSSPAENIYYVNGMNVTNFRTFVGGTTIPFDFYDQVEVKTGGYQAEFGRSTGGAFVATTRSGSNEFHGGIQTYITSDSLASQSPRAALDLDADPDNPTYTRGWAGVNNVDSTVWLSGPLMKDHIYFFAFYNQRDFEEWSEQSYEDGTVYRRVTENREDPFYGGRLDFVLNPNHRVEFTYFVDSQYRTDDYTYFLEGNRNDPVFTGEGGLTRIVKYTGKMTDWFTLSAMYGRSTYDQTTSSALDTIPAVYENGTVVRGNPALLVEVGNDLRENLRLDADFYFNLLGRHHLKVGGDQELLTANNTSKYSGDIYYRYYGPGTNCGSTGNVIDNCVRVRTLFSGGTFDIKNTAFYVQDSWTINDRLTLNLGIRSDTFTNYNANGIAFLNSENQVAPRLGLSYDVFGDKTTKLTAFVGRYYLPIAGNTNIRLAGAEDFVEDYYTYTSRDATTLVPTLGTQLRHDILSNGVAPSPETVVSHNLEPQYQDEFILGLEKRFSNGLTGSVHYMYRTLGAVMEDADLNVGGVACTYLKDEGVHNEECDPHADGHADFGGSGYVLINPGKDVIVTLGDSFGAGAGETVTIPSEVLGFPEAERTYSALTFTLSRPWDGKWFASGSLTLSKSEGNIEGGVKSDNGQDDTGLTQDFDQVGWTDGSFGLLPNHHGISLKAYGAYQVTDRLLVGASAAMLSPRKYGCIGYYPYDDGRVDGATATSWYCNGNLTPRGESFDGDWINKVDVSATYEIPLTVGAVALSAEVFNLFDAHGADQFHEVGEVGGSGTAARSYGMPSSYQMPRTVRLGAKYKF